MRALLAAALVLLAAAGEAHAQAKRDVQVESDPPGADVYLNSKDDGSLCKTPCTIKAPIGEQIVIVEIANHVSLVESLVVPRRGKPATLRFKLQRAVGTLIVKGPEGARIRVGDVDKGKAPAKLDIDAGPHTITLTLNGKQVLQDLVEVEPGQEVVVRGKDVATGGSAGGSGGGGDGGGGDTGGGDGGGGDTGGGDGNPGGGTGDPGGTGTGGITVVPAPRSPNDKLVAVTGLIDIGFRSFSYENPADDVDELSGVTERGQVIAGPMVEVWPGIIAGVPALRGLAVVARIQFPINKQPVDGALLMGTTTTFWQSLEISARHRWTFSQKGTVEASFGFVRDQHQFNTNEVNLKFVPDADYRSIKLGVRGSLLIGSIEPYLAAENRIVLSGGDGFDDRFPIGASASGLRAALGAHAKLGPLLGRLETSFTRYSWTFKFDPTARIQADGASDSILMISVGVGYAY
jgi:uncharacterized membrane protein YgcG